MVKLVDLKKKKKKKKKKKEQNYIYVFIKFLTNITNYLVVSKN